MNDFATQVADALDGAADQILIHGWGQSSPEVRLDPTTLCIQQALMVATSNVTYLSRIGVRVASWSDFCPVGTAALNALREGGFAVDLGGDETQVWAWNDCGGRTEDDVHDALRNTAKAIREGELEVR